MVPTVDGAFNCHAVREIVALCRVKRNRASLRCVHCEVVQMLRALDRAIVALRAH